MAGSSSIAFGASSGRVSPDATERLPHVRPRQSLDVSPKAGSQARGRAASEGMSRRKGCLRTRPWCGPVGPTSRASPYHHRRSRGSLCEPLRDHRWLYQMKKVGFEPWFRLVQPDSNARVTRAVSSGIMRSPLRQATMRMIITFGGFEATTLKPSGAALSRSKHRRSAGLTGAPHKHPTPLACPRVVKIGARTRVIVASHYPISNKMVERPDVVRQC